MSTITKETLARAEDNSAGQSYPVLVNNLRELGVTSYTIEVSNQFRRIFSGGNTPVLEISGPGKTLHCAERFDLPAVKAALLKTQAGQSDYPTFLMEIAAAGVHTYNADLENRTVTYFGKNLKDNYKEVIPNAG